MWGYETTRFSWSLGSLTGDDCSRQGVGDAGPSRLPAISPGKRLLGSIRAGAPAAGFDRRGAHSPVAARRGEDMARGGPSSRRARRASRGKPGGGRGAGSEKGSCRPIFEVGAAMRAHVNHPRNQRTPMFGRSASLRIRQPWATASDRLPRKQLRPMGPAIVSKATTKARRTGARRWPHDVRGDLDAGPTTPMAHAVGRPGRRLPTACTRRRSMFNSAVDAAQGRPGIKRCRGLPMTPGGLRSASTDRRNAFARDRHPRSGRPGSFQRAWRSA